MNNNAHKMRAKEVSRDDPVPLYLQIKQVIKEQIVEGVLEPGAALPSERKLCKIYDVSHIVSPQ
jgi:GntR family transcriptional regulator